MVFLLFSLSFRYFALLSSEESEELFLWDSYVRYNQKSFFEDGWRRWWQKRDFPFFMLRHVHGGTYLYSLWFYSGHKSFLKRISLIFLRICVLHPSISYWLESEMRKHAFVACELNFPKKFFKKILKFLFLIFFLENLNLN